MTERPGSLADYLAAERTFLAWIRTGLALMGFGFVVARFGLFLQMLRLGSDDLALRNNAISLWIGTTLIAIGVAVNIWCVLAHVRLVRQLERGESAFGRPSALAVGLAVILACVGLAMAIHLVSVGGLKNSNVKEKSMNVSPENGIVTLRAHQSVDETLLKLERILEAKAVKLFAVIDHSGEAHKAGLEMPPTKLLIFGSPKAGTPLMLASPSVAIDLPLKLLVHEDRDGQTFISYNSPSYLQARHTLPPELMEKIAVVEALAKAAAE